MQIPRSNGMVGLFLLLLVSPLINPAGGFLTPSRLPRGVQHHDTRPRISSPPTCHDAAGRRGTSDSSSSIFPGDDATLVASNVTLRVDATALAESKKSPSPFQIQRPRWYNKNEVAIIVLLCQRLNMLDLKGVEHMLDAQKNFAKEDPVSLFLVAVWYAQRRVSAFFRVEMEIWRCCTAPRRR